MKTISLTQGKVALVDDADYEAVSQFKWYAHKVDRNFYAARRIWKFEGKRVFQYLHHFLMPGVERVDHRDGNSLNDQMENLRPATHQQNLRGFQQKRLGTTSRYRGVYRHSRLEKWAAQIKVDKKMLYLGVFDIEEDAARAYDVAARKYFGEFASLNFL